MLQSHKHLLLSETPRHTPGPMHGLHVNVFTSKVVVLGCKKSRNTKNKDNKYIKIFIVGFI